MMMMVDASSIRVARQDHHVSFPGSRRVATPIPTGIILPSLDRGNLLPRRLDIIRMIIEHAVGAEEVA
jgi:hypothetical protein